MAAAVEVEGTRCEQSTRAVSELLLCFVGDATGTQGQTHIVQPLEHNLQHARPFGAVVSQLRARCMLFVVRTCR